MKNLILNKGIFLIVFFLFIINAEAQCSMCRAALETEETGVQAAAINDGIVYLMAFPYLLLVFVGWAIYRVMKHKKQNKNT